MKSFPENDFYVADAAAAHAIAVGGQFNIIDIEAGHKVDLIVPAKSDWPEQLARRRQVPLVDGKLAWFIAPEQVILHKMDFYREGGSEKHLRDIASMIKVADTRLDTGYIDEWADRLGLGEIWREVVARVGDRQ